MRERVRELADGGLVDAVAAGADGAAEELYRRYHEPVRRHALWILRDREDAEDVAQTVMTRAIAGMEKHRPRRLRPWLMTITRNEALMLLRSRLPREALSPDLPAAGTVDGTFALREQVAGLVVDLRALPERQRAALVLHQLYDLSYRDIGQLLGVRPGTARENVREARRSLRARAEGREQDCGDVRLLLRDGRARRGIAVRAHLDVCSTCRAAYQPSLATRLKGLLPLPEPLIPPLLLRLAGGPGAGVRGAGGPFAAALCTFAIGLGIVGEVRRGDDGPPASVTPHAAVQPPDRSGVVSAVTGTSERSAERGASAPVAGSRLASTAPGAASAPVPGAPAAVQTAAATPVSPDADGGPAPRLGARPQNEPEPVVKVTLMNGSVSVYAPHPVPLNVPPVTVPTPGPLPAVPLPFNPPLPEPESAPLVGALTR